MFENRNAIYYFDPPPQLQTSPSLSSLTPQKGNKKNIPTSHHPTILKIK